MAKIPFNTTTTEFVLNNQPDFQEDFTRGYLGMSGVADDCLRKVWLNFRFASLKFFPRRVKRIFERGDWEEHRVIKDLKEIGIEVFRREDDGTKVEIFGFKTEKQEAAIGIYGHEKGHLDGRCLGVIEAPKTEHLLEIKTMNDTRFKKFKKVGIKESDPKYYGQVQKYMHHKKLTRTLFVVVNKDNEERGIERIRYDEKYAIEAERKSTDIIMSDNPNFWEKFSRTWFACKGCANYDLCHNDAPPVKTCRSCKHVDLAMEGKWLCGLNNDKELSLPDQLNACPSYSRLF